MPCFQCAPRTKEGIMDRHSVIATVFAPVVEAFALRIRRSSSHLLVGVFLFAAGIAQPAAALASRTFVSGSGIDGNPCTRALPCRTFTFALGLTSPFGEI